MTVWRLRMSPRRGAMSDVLLQGDEASTVDEVSTALQSRGITALPLTVDGVVVDARRTLSEIGLVHGCTIGPGGTSASRPPRRPGMYLVAVSGPEAGRWAALPEAGSIVVGRAAGCDFLLNDALVSSAHVRIAADSEGSVSIEDLGSSNGTFLENQRIQEKLTIVAGQYAQVGATVLTLVHVRADDLHELAFPKEGSAAFQRQFRPALPALPETFVAPTAPEKKEEEKGRLWLQLLLPLASAAGIVVYSGKWIFLLLVIIAPLAMFGFQYARRRRQRAKEAQAQRAYQEQLAQYHQELASIHRAELHRRRSAAVVGGEAILMGELATERLWERDPADPDYLEVCVGLAAQQSMVRAGPERGSSGAVLWGVPLGVSVVQTGSLLVSGRQHRARAVGRSIVLNLAATHSPRDVQISVFTTEQCEADWNWARWLPHTFSSESASRIFATADQRDAMMSTLVQRIETWDGPAPVNAHIVIIDGAANVDGAWLTTVLRRGPLAGIYGVVLEERYTPEGIRGTLRLGVQPDEGVFTSATLSETTGVLTAELAPEWAEGAALSMAGFQPASRENAGTMAAEVRLLDLVSERGVTADWVRQQWQTSPRENVVVGLAGQTPVHVDIVRHGPHAIVGGATRSGKTEFLLTWLTSLCLYNSPEDLAIIVADFKGGVDHVQTARLPHVISLSTNKDIRAFERTLIMLESEIKRREHSFASAGTSNIEAYRVKRSRDRTLAPVPRLLVVVDEFSELRQTDREVGNGYMGRLESVARVGAGLGIHLVLVTQNFADGQLPAQIESQIGLGVCFRVEAGAHSKVVLRSSVASTIPADRPGRGWARLRGLDLQEFQSARVAGRRRDLAAAGNSVVIDQMPFTSVCSAAAAATSGAVPHEDTDLVLFLDAINDAAKGFPSVVPWPDELDQELTLSDLLAQTATAELPGCPIGLRDLPEKQRQEPAALSAQDRQVLVVGSSNAQVGDALLTLATAEAMTNLPDTLHLYGIDLETNWLQCLAALPHTGAVACLNDGLGMRIVRLLHDEADRRRALFDQAGATDLDSYRRISSDSMPRVRLYVNGADRLTASSGSDANVLARPISSLLADAPGTGIDVTLGGGANLVGRSVTQRVNRTFVLRLSDTTLYRGLGVPKFSDVELEVPMRACDLPGGHTMQFGRLASGNISASEVVEALGDELRRRLIVRDRTGWPKPMPEVSWPLLWSRLDLDSLQVPQGYDVALPVGVDSNTARWRWLDIDEDGPVLAIGGGSRSGRSAALLAIAELASILGWSVQGVAPTRRSPLHRASFPVTSDLAGLTPAVSSRTLYLIDDVHRLESTDAVTKLIEESTRPFLIVVAGPDSMLSSRIGVMRPIPEIRSAITLASTGTTAIGGSRIPDHVRADPRPGRGMLWLAGELGLIHIPLPEIVAPK